MGEMVREIEMRLVVGLQPHHPEHVQSHLIWEAKWRQAWLALGWEKYVL